MDSDTLVILLAMVGIPVGLLAAAGIMGWRYRLAIQRSMTRAAATTSWAPPPDNTEGAPTSRPGLVLRYVDAVRVHAGRPSAEKLLAEARYSTAQARRAYVVAALAYSAVTALALSSAAKELPFDGRITIGWLVLAPALLITTLLLRLSFSRTLVICVSYSLVTALLALVLFGRSRSTTLLVAVPVIALYPSTGLLMLLLRRLQPFLFALAAALIYVVVGAAISLLLGVTVELSEVRLWLTVPIALASVVLGVVILGWLLNRRSIVGPVALLLAMGVLGLLIGTGTRPVGVEVIGGFLFGAMTNTFQFYVVWVVFRLFLRLQAGQILTTELLHSHLCWGFLTLYFLLVSGSALYVEATWLPWTLGLALLLYIAALHTGLGLARIKRAGKSGRRLLLLRTFSKDRNRENLLDSLDDRWRRIGRIDLITGTDLAVRTLAGRMLEAFLLRRVDDQFLKTREEVNRRLEHLRSDIEGDVRYPVNSVSCYESAWQHALGQLVPESDVLLMDLRGFTMENRGCRFELIYVVQRVGLRRVIVLVDRRTDVDALTRTAQGAWEELPSDSPNVLDPEPVLNVLRFDAPTERNADALFSLLLDAATTEDPAVQQGMRVATEAVS